jgi:hypothetical protein
MNTKPGYVIAAVDACSSNVLATLGASPTVGLRDWGDRRVVDRLGCVVDCWWPDSFRYGSFGLRRIRERNAGDVHCHAGLWFDARTTKSASSELP